MTEKYKKYKKIINKPQQLTKQGFDAVKNWSPENNWWQLLRVPGVAVTFSANVLTWLLTRIGFENPIIEKLDDVNANKKINPSPKTKLGRATTAIRKQKKAHPTLSAFVAYYMMLAALVGAGKIVVDRVQDNIKEKKERKIEAHRDIDDLKIDPNVSSEEWNRQMDAIWPYLYMETILSEGFVDEAYADVGDSKGYMTIGSGFMIGKANPKGDLDREIIKERKQFFQKALGKPYVNGVSVSKEENRILVRRFYEKFVWPYMKSSFTTQMDAHLFIELCVANFNRGSGIFKDGKDGENIKNAVNSGADINNIVNSFDDLCKGGYNGLYSKYGVAAHRALGNVSDEDVLNSLANSVYDLSKHKLWHDGSLKEYDDVARDLRRVSNSNIFKNGKTYVQHRLTEYLYPEEIETITRGKLFVPSLVNVVQPVIEHEETNAEQLNIQGEALFVSGDYLAAVDKFNSAIAQNPQLYIVYSNLSLAYYKLGEYQKGIDVVAGLINSNLFKTTPATVKGYTYYNAALCYEKLGDNATNIAQKKKYYESARKNAELGEQIAKTKYSAFDTRINDKISKLNKSKKIAFNDGVARVKLKMENTKYQDATQINLDSDRLA